MVVVMVPALDENLGLEEGVEDFTVEELVAQLDRRHRERPLARKNCPSQTVWSADSL